ncbi:MAG: HD domain-containing protein [Desulfocapsaceae bacterium]
MQKERFIKDLSEGEQLDELFMVKAARLGETRTGKPYLSLQFSDSSGEISGPAWDNAEALEKTCSVGAIVRVRGSVQTYREKLQLKVDDISAVEQGEYRMDDFIPASRRRPESMETELFELIDSIKNPFLKKLLLQIFTNTEPGQRFLSSPAAKGIHHAYLGGLLEHSLSMARVAILLAEHYANIDGDLLVAGALLHDIGKTAELDNEVGVIDYTDIGRLKGHLVIGCEFIGRAAEKIKDFPTELLTHLQHLVLSHHGRQEFGSPVVPMTAEALLLSFIDDMDAKMNLVEQLSVKLKSDSPVWSDYQRSLERHLLLKPVADQKAETGSGRGDGPSRQPNLFD